MSVYLDILNSLKGLRSEKFDEFCNMLPFSEPPISEGEVEGKSRVEIAKLLLSRWTKDKVLDKTIDILRTIDCNNEANTLAEKAAAKAQPQQEASRTLPPGQASSSACPSAAPARQGHFVDRHRKNLIERVSNMDPILDHLFDKGVLDQEQYDETREFRRKQEQMRFLYSGPLKSGGNQSKDVLLDALEKYERYLIQELKEMEG